MRGSVTLRLAAVAGCLLTPAGLFAQAAETGSGAFARDEVTANARVVPGLSIQKTEDLNIGDVRVGATAGQVRVEVLPGPMTSRFATGGVVLAGSAFNAAQFSVTTGGVAVSRFQVTLPNSVTLSRVGGGDTMIVQDFRASLAPPCSVRPQCEGAPYALYVGVTLAVRAEQREGSYAGTFTVTVNQF